MGTIIVFFALGFILMLAVPSDKKRQANRSG
jgi:MFS-type transporter involved in bile tolerance (Atg22 family)